MICRCCINEVEMVNKEGVCPDCEIGAVDAPAASEVRPRAAIPRATTAIATRPPVEMTESGVALKSLDDLARFSQMIFDSGLAPAGMKSPQAVAVAVQCGMELGFSPMRALSAVFVLNGRPGIYGQAALAKIRASGALKAGTDIATGITGSGDERVGYVRIHRAGASLSVERTFSVADAKLAGLWKKAGPWTLFPEDMLIWRAVAKTGKLDWSDVLMGFEVAEVLADYSETERRVLVAPEGPDPLLEV